MADQDVNMLILDAAIRHALYLERFKSGQVAILVDKLNRQVIPDLMSKIRGRVEKALATGMDSGPLVTREIQLATSYAIDALRKATQEADEQFGSTVKSFAELESTWQVNVLEHSIPISITPRLPSPERLLVIAEKADVQGKITKTWFSRLADSTAFKIRDELSIGISQGEGVEKLMTRIRGMTGARDVFGSGVIGDFNRSIKSIVRTTLAEVSSDSREAAYIANQDVVKAVLMVAVLDSRTTPICMGYDGKTYPVGEGPRPPFHWNCRTIAVPVTRSWRELGIDKDEASEGERASMNGLVPAKLTYGEWLKRQPISFQEQVLGQQKAAMFRSGAIRIDQFVDPQGRVLTLDELRIIANRTTKGYRGDYADAVNRLIAQLERTRNPVTRARIKKRLEDLGHSSN